MTESRSADRTARRQTMADVDHVHRYDPGASVRFYSRGPAAFTDGGRDATEPDEEEEQVDTERANEEQADQERTDEERAEKGRRMKDVSHTPPSGDPEVNRVFERGEEGRDDGR